MYARRKICNLLEFQKSMKLKNDNSMKSYMRIYKVEESVHSVLESQRIPLNIPKYKYTKIYCNQNEKVEDKD